MIYRVFRDSDNEKAMELILSVFKEFGYQYDGVSDSDINNIYSSYADGYSFIAEEKGELIGIIAIKKQGETGLLKRFYIKKEHRNIGIGYNLFHMAMKYCRENGIKTINVEVEENFESGIDFYLSNKFQLYKNENGKIYLEKQVD